MGYSQTCDSTAGFVGSSSPLVEHELQIGGTGFPVYGSFINRR